MQTSRAILSVSVGVAVLALSPAARADVTGLDTVVDGDTLVVAGEYRRAKTVVEKGTP